MLEIYRKEQPIATQILNNIVTKNKYSHAYLFEINGYDNSDDYILEFVKELITCNIENKEEKTNICKRIDSNNFPDLKIITADGQTIKKEQIDLLQEEFTKTSVEIDKKIYIIKEAEKLNPSSSNALLKFLEEPTGNIIAILLTNNSYQLLPTIKSRCQMIKLKKSVENTHNDNLIDKIANILYQNNEDKQFFIEEELKKLRISKIIDFIEYYEENRLNALLYMKKIWHANFGEKEDYLVAVQIMILFYKDVLNYLLEMNLLFDSYSDKVEKISSKNNINMVIKKINIVLEIQKNIKSNANLSLIMDKFIMTMEEVYENR